MVDKEKTYIEQYYEIIQSGVIYASQGLKEYLKFTVEKLKTGKKSLDIKKRNKIIEIYEKMLGYKLSLFNKVFIELQMLKELHNMAKFKKSTKK